MNTPLGLSSNKTRTVGLRRDSSGGDWKANGIPPNLDNPKPLWLQARARTIGFRRADLEHTHWRKVWRSMEDD
jgi:hypothetical protein